MSVVSFASARKKVQQSYEPLEPVTEAQEPISIRAQLSVAAIIAPPVKTVLLGKEICTDNACFHKPRYVADSGVRS
jgi:hypothetical protein